MFDKESKTQLPNDTDLSVANLPPRSGINSGFWGSLSTVCAAIASTVLSGCYYEGSDRDRWISSRAIVVPAQPGDGSIIFIPQNRDVIRGADFDTRSTVQDLIDPQKGVDTERSSS